MGCVLDICSAGMWPTKRGEGASPSHLLCISPLIQQQPLNLIFQHFSPWALCSVFSCGMCWRTQLIVKTLYLWSCFPSLYLFFSTAKSRNERFRFVPRSHKAWASVHSDLHHGKIPAEWKQKLMVWKLLSVCHINIANQIGNTALERYIVPMFFFSWDNEKQDKFGLKGTSRGCYTWTYAPDDNNLFHFCT